MNIQLIDSLVKIINSLTEEERKTLEAKLHDNNNTLLVVPTSSEFVNEPFVGMWQDREDMNDSSEWVRQLRQKDFQTTS